MFPASRGDDASGKDAKAKSYDNHESHRPGRIGARILIVDHHPVSRYGLAALIARTPGLEVCGEAETADEAMGQIEATRPDLAIVDIQLCRDTNNATRDIRVRIAEPAQRSTSAFT